MAKINSKSIVCLLILLVSACADMKVNQADNGVINFYPDKIIEFHIAEESPEMLFIFTSYHAPYSGTFEVITFMKDGTLLRYIYTPGFAHKGTVKGEFSQNEVVDVKENLDIISHSRINYSDYGTYNFTVTILTSSPAVVSCNETNCPKQFCYFYELVKVAAAKQNPSYAPPSYIQEDVICPITEQ